MLLVLHDVGLLPFCADVYDWNKELILQIYATLHISGEASDVNTWILDWMSGNTHYTAPATELLHCVPIPIPLEGARCIYDEPEL